MRAPLVRPRRAAAHGGEVYRADDLRLSQTVALKFLPASLAQDETALSRFVGEVRVARQITHPNVCRVYDIGEAEGRTFLSMEYIDGEDLGERQHRQVDLNLAQSRNVSRAKRDQRARSGDRQRAQAARMRAFWAKRRKAAK